ncbi:MAG: PASTA domain-containing protein, partial [Micrococcales bacterium]
KDASELLEVTQRVLSELKNGRADTVKLDVLETAKTRIYSAEELGAFEPDAAATQDLNDLGLLENPTQRLEVSAASNDNSALSNFARRRRTRAKFLTVVIPVLAILAGLAGFLVNGGINTIPDLKNNSVETALASLQTIGANVSQEQINDKTIAAGKVIATEPASGSLLWRGQSVKLLISLGPRMLDVPSLNGLSQAEATAALSSAGFTLGTVYQSFSPATKDTVYQFTGDDKSQRPEGSAIDIELSLGDLPLVEGKTEADAKVALGEYQLSITETQTEYSETVPKGMAIRIDPVQTPLRISGEVVLVVSKGPTTVIMPKVIGETLSAAKRLLESLGLKVLVNTDQLTANWGIVKVKSVSAPAASTVHIGDKITISNR